VEVNVRHTRLDNHAEKFFGLLVMGDAHTRPLVVRKAGEHSRGQASLEIRRNFEKAIDFAPVLVLNRDAGGILVLGMRLNTDVIKHVVESFVVSLENG
jgi:hypothetical protein